MILQMSMHRYREVILDFKLKIFYEVKKTKVGILKREYSYLYSRANYEFSFTFTL